MNSKKYTAFFCEENVWHVVNNLENDQLQNCKVLFLSNKNKTIALANQKAAEGRSHVIWDYHTVIHNSHESKIYDFESMLGFESDIDEYFIYTFGNQNFLYEQYQTKVIPIPAIDYKEEFFSDRSHMLDENGNKLHSLPKWPEISQKGRLGIKDLMNLDAAIIEKYSCYSTEEYLEEFS